MARSRKSGKGIPGQLRLPLEFPEGERYDPGALQPRLSEAEAKAVPKPSPESPSEIEVTRRHRAGCGLVSKVEIKAREIPDAEDRLALAVRILMEEKEAR